MTPRQQIAAVLLKPELARLPEYAAFREMLRQAMSVDDIDNEMVERLYAALPN